MNDTLGPASPDSEFVNNLIRSLTRAGQALSYYAADHPAATQTIFEAWRVLQQSTFHLSHLTLATTGRGLIVDATHPPLENAIALSLAKVLFERDILGLCFGPMLNEEGFNALVQGLCASPHQFKTQDKLSEAIARAPGVDVVVVDFGALFETDHPQIPAAVHDDPVLERALRSLLRFEEGAGKAITIKREDLKTPSELGAFMESILQQAQNERTHQDDIIDAAHEAYRLHIATTKNLHGDLAASALVMSNALVRLPPNARFELLRRFAESPPEDDLLAPLSPNLTDNRVVEAVSAALLGGEDDEGTVRAIGQLLNRLRPIAQSRKRMLAEIDGELKNKGQAIDGLLWQSLEARVLNEDRRGFVELTDPQSEAGLIEQAYLRTRRQTAPVPGQNVLFTLRPGQLAQFLPELYRSILETSRSVSPDRYTEIMQVALDAETQGDRSTSTKLLALVARRAVDDLHARELFRATIEEDYVPERIPALLSDEKTPLSIQAWLLLVALDRSKKADAAQIHTLLRRIPPGAMEPLFAGDWGTLTARRLEALLEAAFQNAPNDALNLGIRPLSSHRQDVRAVAIKALAHAPRGVGLRTLATLAGVRGPRAVGQLLAIENPDTEILLTVAHQVIDALTSVSDKGGVQILEHLLTRSAPLINASVYETLRKSAARALARNNSEPARQVLQGAYKSRSRAVRAAVKDLIQERPHG